MSVFSKFLKKHADDLRAVSSAIATLTMGIALDKGDREHVQKVVDKVQAAADSIDASLKSVAALDAAKVSKEDIKAAVASALPEVLSALSVEALDKLLAKKKLEN